MVDKPARRRRRKTNDRPVLGARSPYLVRGLMPQNALSEEGLATIEHNADTILAEIGMDFVDDPEVLATFAKAGCDVAGSRVRFEPGFCRRTISATAPKQFVQHARNPANSVLMGGDGTVLCPSWGPPFVHDLERGRRYASLDDFHTLVKLHHSLPWLHHSGGVVCEPVDVPANKRHLDMLYSHVRFSDRAFMGAFIGAERAGHAIDMARIVFGETFVRDNAVLYCVSNTNAPLVMD
ncbi:MAG: trimethylamine methyltransferase family protein, partial [Pseudomonadota bacterium]